VVPLHQLVEHDARANGVSHALADHAVQDAHACFCNALPARSNDSTRSHALRSGAFGVSSRWSSLPLDPPKISAQPGRRPTKFRTLTVPPPHGRVRADARVRSD